MAAIRGQSAKTAKPKTRKVYAPQRPVPTLTEAQIDRQFDPPDHYVTKDTKALSDAELTSVMSGSGYIQRFGPGGTAEQSAELHAWRSRGLWPYPGLYHQMLRQDPKQDSAVMRLELTVSGADWAIVGGSEYQRDFFTAMFEAMGGIGQIAARVVFGTYTYGFQLSENVWDIDSRVWRIEDLVVIEPWQVHRWSQTPQGFWTGAFCLPGPVWIPREKLAHFARRYTGRNPEGWSALRSLYYLAKAKRRKLVLSELTDAVYGPGMVVFQQTEDSTAEGYDEAEELANRWAESDKLRMALPHTVNVRKEMGAGQKPNIVPEIQYLDNQAGLVTEDYLMDLTQNVHGSHAAGQTFDGSKLRSARGLGANICSAMRQQTMRPVVVRNQWPLDEMPHVVVYGFDDPAMLRLAMDGLRDKTLTEEPGDQQNLRRRLGL